MKLAGFNFTKIAVEKTTNSLKDLKIETKINLIDIQEIKQEFAKTKDTFLGIDFSYIIEYSPSIALLEFKGHCVLALDQKQAKDVLRDWKDKKMDDIFRIAIFNLILMKANIKALQFEEELNLPLHFRLPSLSPIKDNSTKK